MKFEIISLAFFSSVLNCCKKYHAEIITDPPGAKVLQSQKNAELGVTPFKVSLPDGKHKLKISLAPYANEEAEITINGKSVAPAMPVKIIPQNYLAERRKPGYWIEKTFDFKASLMTYKIRFGSNGAVEGRPTGGGTWELSSMG